MKVVIFLILLVAVLGIEPKCEELEQIKCQDDINIAYPMCKKAAEEKGKDMSVDLNCMKYFAKMTEECWACICWFAKKENWKVIGCDQ